MNGIRTPEPGVEDRVRAGGDALERSLPLVLLVVAVGAVVTVATNGLRLLLPATDLDARWMLGVRVAGAAVAAAGVAGLFVERRRIRAGGLRGPDPTVAGLRAAATIMGVMTLMALLNPPPTSQGSESDEASFSLAARSPFGTDAPGGEVVDARSRGGESQIRGEARRGDAPVEPTAQAEVDAFAGLRQRMARFFEWGLLAVLAVVGTRYLWRRLRRRPTELPVDDTLVPADAEASLVASLDEIGGDSRDPRRQITDAYRRLLAALATAGASREPQEAPHEHLHRALEPLGVRPGPLHRLTGLYVRAQFGGRPVTERHRAAAADALEVSLADLRRDPTSHAARGADSVPEEAWE